MRNEEEFLRMKLANGVTVELECGHPMPARSEPMNRNARFACKSGLGCGYRLRWRAWWRTENPDKRYDNKDMETRTDDTAE